MSGFFTRFCQIVRVLRRVSQREICLAVWNPSNEMKAASKISNKPFSVLKSSLIGRGSGMFTEAPVGKP